MSKAQFVYVTYIAATPERVFAALTEAAGSGPVTIAVATRVTGSTVYTSPLAA